MIIIAIVILLWSVSALVRMATTKKQNARIERTKAEQSKLREEWRQRQAEAKLETARLIAVEREQMRQAEQLAKHEERIEALEYKVRKLDRDIESQQELLADYYAQLDWLLLQQSGTTVGGNEFAKWQNKIVTKSNQIRKAENKLADMKDAKSMANRKLEVA